VKKKKLCRARRFAVRPRTRRRPRRHRLPEQSGGGRRSRLPSYRDHEARGAREEATSSRRCRRGARRLRRRRWRGRTPRPERPPGSPPSRPSTRSTSSAPASKWAAGGVGPRCRRTGTPRTPCTPSRDLRVWEDFMQAFILQFLDQLYPGAYISFFITELNKDTYRGRMTSFIRSNISSQLQKQVLWFVHWLIFSERINIIGLLFFHCSI